MINKQIFFLLLFPFYFFAQSSNNVDSQTISGFITYDKKPLENVSIFVENTTRFAVSNNKGFYSIKAKVGETISFSYVGLERTEILIEDVTSILNVDLKIRSSITQSKFYKVAKLRVINIGEHIKIPSGILIDGNSLNKNSISLTKAIQEKIPYLLVRYNDYGEEITYLKGKEMNGPVLWSIDNEFFDIPFDIFISEVKDVFFVIDPLKRPLIRVNTTIDYNKIKNIDFNNYYFYDDEYYNFDAVSYKKVKIKYPFLEKYHKLNTKEAFDVYLKTNAADQNITNFHFALFNRYKKEKNNQPFLLKILTDYEEISSKNPENLKAIAYKYQEIDAYQKAIEVYKKIIELRPNYAQSYRDLGNLFLELKQYRNAWLIYKFYFNKGFKIEDNDIGEIMSSEIISTYNLDSINKPPFRKIKIDNPFKNKESDVRVVFEWNTTEAEFIIELINPNLDVFELENSLTANQGLIEDQKKNGYSAKEIFIDQLNYGNYLVNVTYLGNKQYKPTSFKITTYYNWGKPNQTKKIDVFDLNQKDLKIQLVKLNRKYLK